MRTTTSLKRLLSFAIALVMLFGMIPAQVAATEDDSRSNQNNNATPVEEWNYTPGLQTSITAPTLMSDGDSTESSADIVEVKVTAVDRSSGETVTVAGADVNLYVGSQLISTTVSGSDGIAEVSLAGLTIEQRQNATISANKIVSRGMAVDGDNREDLYKSYPKYNGQPYRYTIELHSETIDQNGNWLGAAIPEGKESNKVDIVFIIDATGSMSDEINNVRTNIASFSENLINSGLDIRFCIIDYRDITLVADDPNEDTHVHTVSGSHWMKDIDSVVNTLASIDATGGGDTPETVVDPLGYVADNSLMSWRSDAYRFAFVLTDADHKSDNNYGYANLNEVADKLAEMEVVTSVICDTYYDDYTYLYETTGGICADIYSSTFDEEMLALSDSIIESVTRKMTLTLREPRLLVNMSVCFYADDSVSLSGEYRADVKNMLNQYAHRMAESTDGHVMLDKIIIYQTSNRINFYKKNQLPSMADIRIETDEADTIRIHSNAYCNGFYTDETIKSDIKEYFPEFNNIPDFLSKRSNYVRIQMSGTEGAGWNNSMIDEAYQYSTTVMHETGHYLLGFFDEYMNANGALWRDIGGYPNGSRFGLMDNQHTDIEISRESSDYTYLASNSNFTYHWNVYRQSCEDTLADLLTTGTTNYDRSRNPSNYYCFDLPASGIFDKTGDDAEYGQYQISYTKAVGTDRTALYPYAELSATDFLNLSSTRSTADILYSDGSSFVEPVFSDGSIAPVTFTSNNETVTITVSSDVSISIMKAGDEEFTDVALTEGSADLPIAKGEMAEVRVTSADSTTYNTYYIDRSEDTDAGYLYTSADNAVMAYVTTDELSSYTFIADNTDFENGEYHSVNQATWICSDNGVGFDSGEIYSVANYLAEIDYTTLSWFKYADGEWTALATDYSEEENMNIGARADLDGEGLYVLMAKHAPVGGVLPAENLTYTQSTDLDAVVTLTFDDPNSDSKYYNVYYSETEFTDKNADGVVVRSFDATSTNLTINLLERGRTVHAAVEIVAEDGRRSELSEIILIGGEADSDGDGISDWYCDKYLLWGEDGENKDIANSDDDGDGLTNLEEYQGGSDPTNPNDPVHTTNVPVESITVSETELTLKAGETAEVTATVMPENASNKNVNWTSENTDVATVEVIDGVCIITAVAEGETEVYAVTADGGYSATVYVTVTASVHEHNYTTIVTDPTCTEQGFTTYTCECGDTYVDDYVDAHGHNVIVKESEPASCEMNGYEYYACEYCGGQGYTIILEATGHNYVDGTCSNCGKADPNAKPSTPGWGNWFEKWFGSWWDDKEDEEKCEHSYTSVVTDPTCKNKGYTTHTCEKCGDSYKDSYVEATGHNYVNNVCEHCGAKKSTGWFDWIFKWFR